ncbi:hypothetical protein PDK35_27030 [Bacillus cereus group sp. TH153LC]|uniref:hypothetical protein n=1 Tax=Bacillus cereus group sp. TH153LC TaxID=3018059 RepID=UPI0022E8F6EE|nr:hypothetical protein [Bacillus cereus group sp. TH153LC]MDA1663566.1 hypothetical protein [Bacillus cereus group sp. TH153LC]
MEGNQNERILYAVFENEMKLPILDITHPLFNASIDEQAYHLNCLKSARSIEALKKMPGFIQNIFVKMSNVDDSYLSGMRTLLYKLGPDLSKGIKLGFRDKWAVKQTSFMGLRIRLRNLCRQQSELLLPQLRAFPERGLCFFNIAGGAAADSINTLILIQESDPELLKGRKIGINILDIDTYGPNFAKRCIDALKQPGERFYGLDITLNTIHYNWSQSESLLKMSLDHSGWIQLCSSEGGLFEYGSDSDIIENLDRFFENSPADARVTGSLIFDRAYVNPGYLGFTEFIGVQIRYLGLEGLQKLLAQTSWILEESHEIEKIYILFSLKKA